MFSLVLYWGRAILCVVVFQLTTWKKNISSWSHLLKVLSWVKKISADFFRCLSPQKRLMSRTSTSRNCRLTAAIRELLSVSILREGKQGWKLVLTRMVFYWIFKKKSTFLSDLCCLAIRGGFKGASSGFGPDGNHLGEAVCHYYLLTSTVKTNNYFKTFNSDGINKSLGKRWNITYNLLAYRTYTLS